MGKTYLETIKYMIVADFEVNGLVERPDVIGAIFGQSEGLLGANLDIKELQQNGKIGRIEIEYTQNQNKVRGVLKLPCSVSMVETAIIGASIETIEKVGPCDAVFKVKQIEDTRGLKRQQIKERAIELLGRLMQEEIPDTKELMDEIMDTFKTKDIISFGPDKLAAGPTVDSSKELIVVEGRADVLNLLRYGFTNTVATGGARIPRSLEEISRLKSVTIFLDGDHGADIQQQQLLKSIKVDYIARAPDGKEVEELTQKEINQALRRRIKSNYLSNANSQAPIQQSFGSTSPSTQTFTPQLTKQPGIVKATKFSTTNDHKLPTRAFENRTPYENRTSYENKAPFENRTPYENRQHKFGSQSFNSHTNNSRPIQEHNPSDAFSQLLSEIPDIERVDLSRDRDNNQRRNGNDRDRNFNRPRNNFSERPNFERRDRSIIDSVKTETESLQSKFNISQPSIKEDLIQQVSEGLQIKLDLPHTRGMEAPNTIVDNNIDMIKTQEIKPVKTARDKDWVRADQNQLSETGSDKKEKPKEEIKKKVIVLPKITDEIKENLGKIIDDIKDKKEARLLNEKFRRISSCSAADLEHKLKEFASDKLFAIAVDQELNDTIKDLAKERGASILVVRSSNDIKDSQIHILNYQELNK